MPPKKNLIVSHQSVNGTPARVMAANELPEYIAALSSCRGKHAAWHEARRSMTTRSKQNRQK